MGKETAGIYQIRNLINGKRYIGSSKHIYLRFRQHRTKLNCRKHDSIILQRAWDKYGEVNFAFEVIERVAELSMLQNREQYHLDLWQSAKSGIGYNTLPLAYRTAGRPPMSTEARKKISDSRKGVIPWNKGKQGIYSEETLEKMSRNRTGIKTVFSAQHRANLRGPKSLESIEKRRQALKQFYAQQPHLLRGEKNPNWGKGKKVSQFTLDGALVASYDSLTLAARALGAKKCNIGLACKGHQKTSNGYVWRYAA